MHSKTDITDMTQWEKHHYTLLEHIEEAITYLDSEGNILWANYSFLCESGLSLEQVVGHKVTDFISKSIHSVISHWFNSQIFEEIRKEFYDDSIGKPMRIYCRLIPVNEMAMTSGYVLLFKKENVAHQIPSDLSKSLVNMAGIINLIMEREEAFGGIEKLQTWSILTSQVDLMMQEIHKVWGWSPNSQDTVTSNSQKVKLQSIWMIDDDPIIRFVTKKFFSKSYPHVHIETYDDAQKALEKSLEQDTRMPDVIFLDLAMPLTTGWDFLDAYKGQIPIYIFSSSLEAEDKKRSEKYESVKGFISKPLSKEKFEKFFLEQSSSVS